MATYEQNPYWPDNCKEPPNLILIATLAAHQIENDTLVQIQRKFPGVPVAVMAEDETFEQVLAAIQMGIKGWIQSTIEPGDLQKAINAMVDEQAYYFDLSTERLVYSVEVDIKDPARLDAAHALPFLHKRILSLFCTPLSSEQIAGVLQLSRRQLTTYRKEISKALQLKSRVGLSLFAIKNHLCEKETAAVSTGV